MTNDDVSKIISTARFPAGAHPGQPLWKGLLSYTLLASISVCGSLPPTATTADTGSVLITQTLTCPALQDSEVTE